MLFRERQEIEHTVGAHQERLDRMRLIVRRRRGRCEVPYKVQLSAELDRPRHVMLDEGDPAVVRQVADVLAPTCDEIVDTDDFVALFEKPVDQVRTEETRSARDKAP